MAKHHLDKSASPKLSSAHFPRTQKAGALRQTRLAHRTFTLGGDTISEGNMLFNFIEFDKSNLEKRILHALMYPGKSSQSGCPPHPHHTHTPPTACKSYPPAWSMQNSRYLSFPRSYGSYLH